MPTKSHLRVGLCGIGLDAYWPQFDGLREQLESYLARAGEQLQSPGVELVPLGLVDSAARGAKPDVMPRPNADLLVLYVTTYALSSTVLPLAQRAGVPILVLNLQPRAAIDYAEFNRLPDRTRMTGYWLA